MTTAAPTSAPPTARHLWRRARGLLLAATVIAVAGIALAALRSGENTGTLDPRSTAPYGSKALTRLLADRGVSTHVLSDPARLRTANGPDTTLVVPFPDALDATGRSALRQAARRSARTVLLAPGPDTTTALTPGVHASAPADVRPTSPRCALPTADRAGDAHLGGYRYTTRRQADACYLRGGKATLLRVPRPGTGQATPSHDTVLLGAPDPLYNKRLAHNGNASLALQLLGSRPKLLWYLPDETDTAAPPSTERGFFDLLPRGWSWAALQLALAAALAAVWRARRLGPLVTEQLPVTVPAAEATEGRARLYRRADARGHAAEALRSASRTRLAALAGLPPAQAHLPEVLTTALAATATAEPPPPSEGLSVDEPSLRSLLFGRPPQDDRALVRLADDLDRLERHLLTRTTPATPSTDKDTPS